MKKVLGLVLVLACVAMISSKAFAVTYSTSTYTATANFTNSGSAAFSFNLFKVSGNASSSAIGWTSTEAFNTSATDKWVRADEYAVVAATVTKAGYGVYMYTANKSAAAPYKATTPRTNADGTKVYSGLVRSGSNGGENRGYIPVAYSFFGTKQPAPTFNGTATTSETRADRFITDVSDRTASGSDGSNFKWNYAKIAGLVGPVFGVDDTTGDWTGSAVTNHTAYMYFFGDFKNIIGGDVYSTTKWHVVTVQE